MFNYARSLVFSATWPPLVQIALNAPTATGSHKVSAKPTTPATPTRTAVIAHPTHRWQYRALFFLSAKPASPAEACAPDAVKTRQGYALLVFLGSISLTDCALSASKNAMHVSARASWESEAGRKALHFSPPAGRM